MTQQEGEQENEGEGEEDAMSDTYISDNSLLLAESQASPFPSFPGEEEDSQVIPSEGEEEEVPLSQAGPREDINNNNMPTPLPGVDTFMTPMASSTPAKRPPSLLPSKGTKRKFLRLSDMADAQSEPLPPGQKKTKLRRALFPKKTAPAQAR